MHVSLAKAALLRSEERQFAAISRVWLHCLWWRCFVLAVLVTSKRF